MACYRRLVRIPTVLYSGALIKLMPTISLGTMAFAAALPGASSGLHGFLRIICPNAVSAAFS